MIKRVFKFFYKLVFLFLLYVIFVRFINPPITTFQIEGMIFANNSSEYDFQRDYISWEEMGKNVKLAAIAGEDQAFLTHSGFDWKSIQKSLLKSNNQGSAASTISQQMVKNAFFWQGNDYLKYLRKIFEIPTTFLIELFYPKRRILEIYLNIAETGPGIYGIEAASNYYFAKPAKELTKREAAKIIACLPNPKKFLANQTNNKTSNRSRWIVRQMNNLETDAKISEFLKE